MNLFTAVLYLHIATVAVSVGLFVLRYWWMYHQSPLLNQRWVRIAPHCSDTLLFLSGAGLMAITPNSFSVSHAPSSVNGR